MRWYCSIECNGLSALYTVPWSKPGGERHTYFTPTYEALKGMLKHIRWTPAITFVIDKVRILERIDTYSETKLRKRWTKSDHELSIYEYLRDVRYQVQFYIEWNQNYKNRETDRIARHHIEMFKKRLQHGSVLPLCFGISDCDVEDYHRCKFGRGRGYYDNSGVIDLGIMFHSFGYPDEAILDCDKYKFVSRYFHAYMDNGVIRFCRPEECSMRRVLHECTKEEKERLKARMGCK